jgi:hypothetical protein
MRKTKHLKNYNTLKSMESVLYSKKNRSKQSFMISLVVIVNKGLMLESRNNKKDEKQNVNLRFDSIITSSHVLHNSVVGSKHNQHKNKDYEGSARETKKVKFQIISDEREQ